MNKWEEEEIARRQKEKKKAVDQDIESCTSEEEKRRLLNTWKKEEEKEEIEKAEEERDNYKKKVIEKVRKEIEREKAWHQHIKEHPDQFPRSFLLPPLPIGCKTEKDQEEEEAEKKAREEIEIYKRKVNEKARINEKIFYPSLLFKSCVITNAYNVTNHKPALLF